MKIHPLQMKALDSGSLRYTGVRRVRVGLKAPTGANDVTKRSRDAVAGRYPREPLVHTSNNQLHVPALSEHSTLVISVRNVSMPGYAALPV